VVGFVVRAKPEVVQANFTSMFPSRFDLGVLAVFGAALVGSLFAADAWNNVTFTGSEVVNPKRNLPLSLFLGTLITCVIYFSANVVYLRVLPLAGIAAAPEDRVGTAVAQTLMGPWGLTFINIAILVSTFGAVNGMVLSGARVYYAMARDGLFFRRAAEVSPRTHTPVFSLVIQAIWISVLVLSGSYNDLLDYVVFAALLFYVLTMSGLFVLRKKRPDLERPFKAFGYPVVPAAYIVVAAMIALDLLWMKPTYSWLGLILVLSGVPVFFFWHSRTKDV